MAVSPHEHKMIDLQHQLRQNQHDLKDFLSDLGNWEDEMKTKEEDIKNKSDKPQDLPPVRNSLDKKKTKKKRKKKGDQVTEKKRISGFDFKSWEKFDVDKALEDIDSEEKKSSSEYETDEEWEIERKKHRANEEKNTGNSHLSAGAYEVAVECYTRGIALDPTNALLPANRAFTLIKMEKYGAAEVDCTTSITLDPLYVKAYLRRAVARVGLENLELALQDYERVLQLEPNNKQAQTESGRLKKDIQRTKEDSRPASTSLETSQRSEVNPVYIPPEKRSTKPLRRIVIEEIGLKENTERKEAIARVEAKQSSAKKAMEAKDGQMFEKFIVKASGDMEETLPSDHNTNGESCSSTDTAHYAIEEHLTILGDVKSQKADMSSASSNLNAVSSSTQKQNAIKVHNGSSNTKPSSPKGGGGFTTSTRVRYPPQSYFQLQADFNDLKNDLQAFYAYFKRADTALYPKLFGMCLDAEMLLTILEAIRTCAIPTKDDCFNQLKGLAEVNRFSIIVMFFTKEEKQGIREIFQHLKSMASHPTCDIDSLMSKYGI